MRWNRNEWRPEKRRVPLWVRLSDGSTPAPAAEVIANGLIHVDKGDGHYVLAAAYGLVPTDVQLVYADATITSIDDGPNTFEIIGHGLETGWGPFRLTCTGTFPAGTDGTTDYWIIVTSVDEFKLADAQSDAFAGTAVDISSSGTGTLKLVDTADTKKLVNGSFVYEAAQTDIDYAGSYFAVRVSGASLEDSIVSVDLVDEVIHAGTATAGTSSTITLAGDASATNGIYTDAIVKIIGGAGRGQSNTVASYVGGTKVATMARAWASTPNSTSQYEIIAGPSGSSASGVATAVWAATGEGAHTYGDLVRLVVGIMAGAVADYETGTYAFKSLSGAKTRSTHTATENGRGNPTIGDLT